MRISVIIPTFNEGKYIEKTLKPLSSLNCEIIIVDNESSDETARIARKYTEHVLIKKSSIPHARNIGSRIAEGNVLMHLDADTILLPETVRKLGRELYKRHAVGGTCTIYPYDGHWYHKVFYACLSVAFSIIYALMIYIKVLRPLVAGACLFIRSDVFRWVGGYGKTVVGEDVDMMLRLSRAGKVIFVKSAVAYTSVRRLVKWGFWRTLKIWTQNTMSYFMYNKPQMNHWEVVR